MARGVSWTTTTTTLLFGVAGLGAVAEARGTCQLAAAGGDGNAIWISNGQVMQLWTSQNEVLERLYVTDPDNPTTVKAGTYFSLFCNSALHHADGGCIIRCDDDGTIDYDTYCSNFKDDVAAACVPFRETRLNRECTIDWKSDELMPNGATKSYRQVWNETLENYLSRAHETTIFGFHYDTIPGAAAPAGFPVLGEWMLNTFGFGINVQNVEDFNVAFPNRSVYDMPFDSSFFSAYFLPNNLTAFPGYVDDPRGSTGDGERWFPMSADNCSDFVPGTGQYSCALRQNAGVLFEWPTEWDMRPFLTLTVLQKDPNGPLYDPCVFDDLKGKPGFFGLPQDCFGVHQIGVHMSSGNMYPYYPPLKDGTLDFWGVCNGTDITDYDIIVDSQIKNAAKEGEPRSQFTIIEEDYGGWERPHYRAATFHLCVDWNGDIYEPFSCLYNPVTLAFEDADNFLSIDPQLFFDYYNTPHDQCAKNRAGLCAWGNQVEGEFDPTVGPPLDWPEVWSPTDIDLVSWHKRGDPSKNCAWVSEFPERRCFVKGNDVTMAMYSCPTSCGTANAETADPRDWHKKRDPSKDCAWVSLFPSARCLVRGFDDQWAYQVCQIACTGFTPPAGFP